MATLAAAVRDFYNEYEYDARGYGHLWLELRAWVCGAPGAEVVARSGVVATAKMLVLRRGCPGPPRAFRTLCVMCVMLAYIKIRLSPLVMILESLTLCSIDG